MLPRALLSLLLLAIPTLSAASPQPALVSDEFLHLVPHNTLFIRQSPTNLQTFNDALGGFKASDITNSGNPKQPFEVDGEAIGDFKSAGTKSCDNQFNDCQKAANEQKQFTVKQCDDQKQKCNDAQDQAVVQDFEGGGQQSFTVQDPEFPDFDLICNA